MLHIQPSHLVEACPLTRRPDVRELLAQAVRRSETVLARRQQSITTRICPKLPVLGDPADLLALITAAILETAALSAATAPLSLSADDDEGDVVVSVVGINRSAIPHDWLSLDPELIRSAQSVGGEAELLWEPGEGPSVVLALRS